MTKRSPSPEVRDALARLSFPAFVHWAFRILHPTETLTGAWYVDAIAYRLQQMVESDDQPRLVLNLPPRALKSFIASVCLPAWLLGRFPNCKIICVSYSDDLGVTFSRDCRRLMDHPNYRRWFPGTRVGEGKATEREFETTRGGFRLTASVGGTLTGRGCDWLIIDDPIKADEAASEAVRKYIITWFRGTARSRLNNPSKGRIVLLQQRLHVDDLSGHLIEAGWPSLIIPAIADRTRTYPIGPDRSAEFAEGACMDPDRLDDATLKSLQAELGSHAFSAQYLQQPVPVEGTILRREWFGEYDADRPLPKFDRIVMSVDPAAKTGPANDYTALTVWGFTDKKYYLLHASRGRWTVREGETHIVGLAEELGVDLVVVEDTSSGTALIELLKEHRRLNVLGWQPGRDKEARLHAQRAKFETGKIVLPANAAWLAELLAELLSFPAGRHDDWVDSVVQALEWATENLGIKVPILAPGGGLERESRWRMGSTIDFRKPFDENWRDR